MGTPQRSGFTTRYFAKSKMSSNKPFNPSCNYEYATTHIETEKQLIPALRFNEFDGEWEKRIAEICLKNSRMETKVELEIGRICKRGIPFINSKAHWWDGSEEDKIDSY